MEGGCVGGMVAEEGAPHKFLGGKKLVDDHPLIIRTLHLGPSVNGAGGLEAEGSIQNDGLLQTPSQGTTQGAHHLREDQHRDLEDADQAEGQDVGGGLEDADECPPQDAETSVQHH